MSDRYIVSNVGFGFAIHDTRQEKKYYEGIDPSEQSGPKGVVVQICNTAEIAYAEAKELNAKEQAS